ncbi:MAG: sugar transferase [Dysosmobacter sp.]|nr:sugar transferase [Dysosmobacter sp.]MDY3866262.1 sugar transferase [Dysosmobacter sp.]
MKESTAVKTRRLRTERKVRFRMDWAVTGLICALTLLGQSIFGEWTGRKLLVVLMEPVLVMIFMTALEAYDHFTSPLQEIQVCILLSDLYAYVVVAFLNVLFLRSLTLLTIHTLAAALQAVLMLACNTLLYRRSHDPRCCRRPSMLVLAAKGHEARLRRLKYGILEDFDAWYMVLDEPVGADSDSALSEIKQSLKQYDALCVFDNVWGEAYEELIRYAMELDKEIYTVPRMIDVGVNQTRLTHFDDIPVLYMESFRLTWWDAILKRGLDLVVALAALAVAALPMAVIAVCIRLDSPGPIIYRQERYTKGKKVFRIMKFRTMVVDAEKLTGPTFAQKDDPRITRVGRLLRRCRLDELPQIFNILRGDMSLVGPRPERPFFVEQFEKEIPQYDYRFAVKAGLTALSHVYGRYSTYIHDRTYYDLRYIADYSFFLDLKILLLTSKTMFLKNAAEGEDQFKVQAEKKQAETR